MTCQTGIRQAEIPFVCYKFTGAPKPWEKSSLQPKLFRCNPVATELAKVYDRCFTRCLQGKSAMDFSNRVAVVTGGTGALGADVVLELAKAGARVAVPYRRKNEWEAIEQRAGDARARLYGSELDLTRYEAVRRFAEDVVGRWGRLDLLFAVAG